MLPVARLEFRKLRPTGKVRAVRFFFFDPKSYCEDWPVILFVICIQISLHFSFNVVMYIPTETYEKYLK
jgi:hypothetical protein